MTIRLFCLMPSNSFLTRARIKPVTQDSRNLNLLVFMVNNMMFEFAGL